MTHTYIGVKVIDAWPQMAKDPHTDGKEDGYAVKYADGYISWSPKAQFEAAYRRIDDNCMSFGLAIEASKLGNKIARKGWNGKNMFVAYMPPLYLPAFDTQDTNKKVNDRTAKWIGKDKPLDCQPYFAMYNAQEQWIPGWVASQSDMLSDDWYIVQDDPEQE